MVRGIFHICLLASFLLLPQFSSTVNYGGFTVGANAPYPWDHNIPPPQETTPFPSPTTSPPTTSAQSPGPAAASSPFNNSSISGDMTWWCNKTPHAKTCTYYFQRSPDNNISRPPRFRSGFLRMLVHVALDQAVITHAQTVKLGQSCTNNQRKAAWSDCVTLFENTVTQLNQTFNGLNPGASSDVKCSDLDAQTWLSTAQTNIETCQSGSEDLKVSDFVMPAISNKNLSDLIGNCLAVNGVLMKQHNHTSVKDATVLYIRLFAKDISCASLQIQPSAITPFWSQTL